MRSNISNVTKLVIQKHWVVVNSLWEINPLDYYLQTINGGNKWFCVIVDKLIKSEKDAKAFERHKYVFSLIWWIFRNRKKNYEYIKITMITWTGIIRYRYNYNILLNIFLVFSLISFLSSYSYCILYAFLYSILTILWHL